MVFKKYNFGVAKVKKIIYDIYKNIIVKIIGSQQTKKTNGHSFYWKVFKSTCF